MPKAESVYRRVVGGWPDAKPFSGEGRLYGAVVEWGRRFIAVTADGGKVQVGNYTREDWLRGGTPFLFEEVGTISKALSVLDRWTGGDWEVLR